MTNVFTTDNIGQPENVVALSFCNKIVIIEDGGTTQAYKVYEPATAVTPVIRYQGFEYTFYAGKGGFFYPGQIVGATSTVSGIVNLSQIESLE